MGFPEAMKRIMRERDIKQADVCRMTGIQTSLMSEYMTGKKGPTLTNALKIADALHLSLDELADIAPANKAIRGEFETIVRALNERPQFRKAVENILRLDDESLQALLVVLKAHPNKD